MEPVVCAAKIPGTKSVLKSKIRLNKFMDETPCSLVLTATRPPAIMQTDCRCAGGGQQKGFSQLRVTGACARALEFRGSLQDSVAHIRKSGDASKHASWLSKRMVTVMFCEKSGRPGSVRAETVAGGDMGALTKRLSCPGVGGMLLLAWPATPANCKALRFVQGNKF